MMRGVSHAGPSPCASRRPSSSTRRARARPRGGRRSARSRSRRSRSSPSLKRHRAAAPADHPRRRRARRVADDRLQGARHLRQRAAARGGGADLRRHVGRHDRRRARASRSGCSSSCRSALTSLIKDQLGSSFLFWLVEGDPAHGDLPRLPRAALAHARPAARVRVPRRRAQDDLLLRGRAAARRPRTRSASRACTRAAGRASC